MGSASDPPVVHAVLFFSSNCGHCHYIIEEVLPPLFDQYGDQLQILGIEISNPEGRKLYQSAINSLQIPETQRGVPTLLVGEAVLVGSLAIPEQLPGLVEAGLANGGITWPDFPGMKEALAAIEPGELANESTAAAAEIEAESIPMAVPAGDDARIDEVVEAAAPESAATAGVLAIYEETANGHDSDALAVRTRIMNDPAGNLLAILVLAGTVIALVYAVVQLLRAGSVADLQLNGRSRWSLLGLLLIGLGISAYLAFVETTSTEAVCGPVGDCNTVQQSEYAVLFGVLPIGILGVLGYVAMALAWVGVNWGGGRWRERSARALVMMALFGVVFSIYLTFLEPFVIGATCMWCLSSVVIMTAILLTVTVALSGAGQQAWQEAGA
ncbi:MAG: vitamin K epoxide reductase family protein [Chloroflexota bacterium]